MRASWCTAGFLLAAAILRANACDQGRASFLAKDYSGAQPPLWDCVIAGTSDKEFAHQLALTYRDLRNYNSGIKHAESALVSHSKSEDIFYILGFLQFRLGHHSASIRHLGQAYRLDPDDWRVYQIFALNYVVLDIKDGALESFQNAIRLNPRNAELLYQLARFYYSDNRPIESIEASRKALAIFPDYPEVFDNLGLCYQSLAQPDEAKTSFEQSIGLSEKTAARNEWPYLDYAAFLIKQESFGQSLPLLRRAIEINPNSAKAYYFQGRAFRKLDRKAEAKQSLEKAMVVDPNDSVVYYELGMLLNGMGEITEGRRMLQRFQTLTKHKKP